MTAPRSGYTLPVFACAAAIAALNCLRQHSDETVSLDLIEPHQTVDIPVEQAAQIGSNAALAITRSDPGDNLDLTRHTPVWAIAELSDSPAAANQIIIQGGEGVGWRTDINEPAIYHYAQRLLRENLQRLLKPGESLQVTIILPQGRQLAQRTSNEAFGVVEGLSLLGTTGIAQPLSAPGQLEAYRQELATKAEQFNCLVFCIGENGLDKAQQLGINGEQLVKTANWLGPLLVMAGELSVREILLFGYHGKLIKLAGGIFHTHHHLADGRLEILTAQGVQAGLPVPILQQLLASPTTEAALQELRKRDEEQRSDWVKRVYGGIAETIDRRAQNYIRQHAQREVCVGSALFDRDRRIIVSSRNGTALLAKLC